MSQEYWADPCARCGGIIQSEKRDDMERALLPASCQAIGACLAGRAAWDGRVECGEDKPADGTFTIEPSTAGLAAAVLGRCAAVCCAVEIPQGRDWCSHHFALIPSRQRAALYHAKTEAQKERALQDAKNALEILEFGKRLL